MMGLIDKTRLQVWRRKFVRVMYAVSCFIGRFLLLSIAGYSFSYAGELGGNSKCIAFPSKIVIDQAWGGARVAFDALEDRDFFYVAYYDADRWLTIAQISKCTGRQEKIRVPSRFGGWDEHNSIALVFDEMNRLHVSGNMHVSALVYARMDEPDRLAGLDVLRSMTGQDETRTTYPYFFRFADGGLGFSYRSGQSGNGIELINRLEGLRWVRWTNQPVFAPVAWGNTVNAYHTDFILGPDGLFHVAWVWRATYKVETNFSVNYAQSPDLRTWQNSKGHAIPLPITPASAEVVDPVPKESGLFNNVRLGFDKTGRPVISYLKFDATGATQLFHARHENGGWKSVPVTKWTYRWNPKGGGTIPSEISFSGVRMSNGRLTEQVRQPEIGVKTLVYSDDSLKVQDVLNSTGGPSISIKDRRPPKGAVLNVQAVRAGKSEVNRSKYRYEISWFSLPVDNRDKPRDCNSEGLSCDFVSDLVLHAFPLSPGADK